MNQKKHDTLAQAKKRQQAAQQQFIQARAYECMQAFLCVFQDHGYLGGDIDDKMLRAAATARVACARVLGLGESGQEAAEAMAKELKMLHTDEHSRKKALAATALGQFFQGISGGKDNDKS